jgi:uncharacterized protein YqgC (DUF456 family)
MYYLTVLLFAIGLTGAWALNLFSLPGNWFMVGLCAIFAYFCPELEGSGQGVGWSVVIAAAVIALAGEILETVAGAAGIAKGGSKRGALLAMVGSFIGSLLGATIGIPIPGIGSLVGALVFAAAGATVGAVIGETWKGSDMPKSVEIGKAAFWGRLFGTAAKIMAGSIILAVAVVAALF